MEDCVFLDPLVPRIRRVGLIELHVCELIMQDAQGVIRPFSKHYSHQGEYTIMSDQSRSEKGLQFR